ncbi:MAG TPA: hypothetical protein VIJ82_29090 [Streptosporangiaceae bacterium]|jgi:hypothetical protein
MLVTSLAELDLTELRGLVTPVVEVSLGGPADRGRKEPVRPMAWRAWPPYRMM